MVSRRPADDPGEMRRELAQQLNHLLFDRERRQGRGVDRAELARRTNVSRSSVYAYLNGTTLPPTSVLDQLLTALDAGGEARRRLSTLRDEIEVAQQRGPRGAEAAVPRQLPCVTERFTGRDAQLARLAALLEDPGGVTTTIAAIDGAPGVGKTTLALWWAHRVKERYPDGQLHIDLRGFDPEGPLDPGEALHRFLHALGAAPESIPDGLDEKSALYRTLLAGRRTLVVLDDARSSDQVRPLLPGTRHSLVIVTSRDRLDGLVVREGAHRVTVPVLPRAEARELLRRWLGPARVAAETGAADELIDLCAGLPLALCVVVARAADRPDWRLAALASRLREAPDRLGALGEGSLDLDPRTVFRASYALLPERAARLFRLIGPYPDVDAHACRALLGAGGPPAAELDALTRANLLTEGALGRFSAHDLLREFARELAGGDPAEERGKATERLLDHYLGTAVRAARALEPCREADLPPAVPDRPGPPLRDRPEAMAWFAAEMPALQAAMRQAAAEGFDRHVWGLAWAATVFLRRSGRRAERVALHRIGLEAALRAGDRAVQATSMRLLGDGLTRLGRQDEALPLLRTSLAECSAIGDARGVFQAHLSLTRLHDSLGDLPEALGQAERALRASTAVGDLLARADGLTHVTKQRERLGRHEEALPLGRRALALYRRLGYAEGEADALRCLGRIERRLNRPEQAIALFERSLELDRLLGDRFWTAHVLRDLAAAHEAAGNPALGRTYRAEAAAMFEAMGQPLADPARAGAEDEAS
ncbi:tetratricopeptide repeat protein [Actinomadura sp. K4S16]|uniref:ATP-binding protein n=1 Tax=Actinomadura sp. K4S16 TaxID=1316147 RepID=UPI00190F8C20|nr:helix-turn-helix domain-containing protein [Actinomadura sp. K4S16]